MMHDAENPAPSGEHSPPTERRAPPTKIRRFVASERLLHWALALPYILLYASAAMLVLLWGEPQPRHLHGVFGTVHRIAGICLIVFPPLVLILRVREWPVHLSNLKEGWIWDSNDIRWLIRTPKAVVNPRITLPEQGKFNAAEKLNFMMVCTTYPLYIATGILIWMPGAAFLPWLLHCSMAVIGLPLVAGHIFMATINPSTRIGLEGMITGWVDREWAKHHYRRWFRECFEQGGADRGAGESVAALLRRPARVRCEACGEVTSFESWERFVQRIFQVEPLFCPRCEREILVVLAEAEPEVAQAIVHHLESGRADLPFERVTRVA